MVEVLPRHLINAYKPQRHLNETSYALGPGGEEPYPELHIVEDFALVLFPPRAVHSIRQRTHGAYGHVSVYPEPATPVCPDLQVLGHQNSCQMTPSFLQRLGHPLPQLHSQERITSLTICALHPPARHLSNDEGWRFAEDVDGF